MLFYSFKVKSRDIWSVCIGKFAVHLVAEKEEVVALHNVANLHHLLAGIDVACRVVRVANHDGARAFID